MPGIIDNRIGSRCWYKLPKQNLWASGILRMWGTSHVEYESGPGLFPIGMVEDAASCRMIETYAGDISFAPRAPFACSCGSPAVCEGPTGYGCDRCCGHAGSGEEACSTIDNRHLVPDGCVGMERHHLERIVP